MDPRTNPLANLISSIATGENVPLELEAAQGNASSDDEEEHHHHKHKKDKKKKKEKKLHDATIDTLLAVVSEDDSFADFGVSMTPEPMLPAASAGPSDIAPEKSKKEKKKDKKKDKDKKEKKEKKDKKKKKKKSKDNDDDDDEGSDFELDSDDDLSLGSIPGSTSSEDEEEEEEEEVAEIPQQQHNKRASVVDGLKGFQVAYKPEKTSADIKEEAVARSKQRRHTLGAALKGFQINLGAGDDHDHEHDHIAGLSKNLPKLSIGKVKKDDSK